LVSLPFCGFSSQYQPRNLCAHFIAQKCVCENLKSRGELTHTQIPTSLLSRSLSPSPLDVPANHTHTELLRAGEEFLCDWTLLQSTPARNFFFFGQVQNLSVTGRSCKAQHTELLRAGAEFIRD
jgi:hypothetical protein